MSHGDKKVTSIQSQYTLGSGEAVQIFKLVEGLIPIISQCVQDWSKEDQYPLLSCDIASYLNQKIDDNTGFLLGVLNSKNEWIGFVSVSCIYKRFQRQYYLTDDFFIVRPDYRNTKVSTAIVDELKRYVKIKGLSGIDVNPSTLTGDNIEKIKTALENKGFVFSGYMMSWRNE
jgi:GNAT superfamily N-acetyltransferase